MKLSHDELLLLIEAAKAGSLNAAQALDEWAASMCQKLATKERASAKKVRR